MPTWYFDTGNPPFLENQDPVPSSTGNAQDTLISFDIVDAESYVRTDTIDGYVNGFLAFSGPSTFFAPYDGPSSSITFLPGGSIEGYDAYRIVIDSTSEYPISSTVTVRAVADDYGFNVLDESWTFDITSGTAPFVEGQDPAPSETNVSPTTLITFFIADQDNDIDSASIDAYVNGLDAYHGTIGFIAPFNGPSSSFTFLPGGSIEGYDAYKLIIDNTGSYMFGSTVTVRAVADDSGSNVLDESWTFDIIAGSAPFVEGRDPTPSETSVSPTTLITFLIADKENDIEPTSIDAYVNGLDAYHGTTGFIAPFDGPSSSFTFIPGGSLEGYDAYQIIIDNTGAYTLGSTVTVRCKAEDPVYALDTSWSFTIEVGGAPFLRNRFPTPGSTGVAADVDISFDVLSDSVLVASSVNVYVQGDLAYNGTAFVPPYNGGGSSFSPTIVDGYDGYHVVVDSVNDYFGLIPVRVTASDAYGSSLDESWAFIVGDSVNIVYFCDGYGLKAVAIADLISESQDYVRTVASATTIPTIPSNNITDIFGNWVRDGLHLALSYDAYQGYGAAIVTNETSVTSYLDGSRTKDGQINDYGTLYIINKSLNRVEVYYGADFRDGYGRSPDYYYSTTSTPSIFHGEVTCLHIESNASARLASGTRLYIGTTLGFTRVDTYDAQTDGYGDGMDGYGISNTYSIIGGGAMHEAIGGTIPRVGALASDEEKSIIFVATNDNLGNGGVTQITIDGNTRIIFMTRENGMLPSNDVRDIFGKEI